MKYLLTLSFAYFFVNVMDFFLWGRGTWNDVIWGLVICIVDVKLIWDILREEEAKNA